MPKTQELRTSIGFRRQAAIGTALAAANCWSLGQTTGEIIRPQPTYEDDAADFGKGTPFATQLYPLALQVGGGLGARFTSEWAAMLCAFGVGVPVKSAAGSGFKYVSTIGTSFSDFDGDMPVTTVVQSVRQGANDVFDFGLIGVALNDFTLTLNTGIGRDTALIQTNWVGSGKYSSPSNITHPAAYAEHSLNVGGATTLTILGTNMLSDLRLQSLEFSLNNNINMDKNYRIGSGTQGGFNLAGRMRRGVPTATLRLSVEMLDGSPEWAAFLAQTAGTVVINIDGAQIGAGPEKHNWKLTLHQVQFRTFDWADNDGDIVGNLECSVQFKSGDGVLQWEAICEQDNVGAAPA